LWVKGRASQWALARIEFRQLLGRPAALAIAVRSRSTKHGP